MDRMEAFSVKLTPEEIVVLLGELGVRASSVIDTSMLDQLNERERHLVLDVARRGLIARQLMSPNGDGTWEISQFALSSLGVSLAPSRTIVVTTGASREAAEAYLFHTAQEVFTNHQVASDGTHQFLIMLDKPAWQRSIFEAAKINNGLPEEVADQNQVHLTTADLTSAYETAQQGSTGEAASFLMDRGVEPKAATYLANDLSGGITFSSITAVDYQDSENQESVSFVLGRDHCWHMRTEEKDGDQIIDLVPLAAREIRTQIEALIA